MRTIALLFLVVSTALGVELVQPPTAETTDAGTVLRWRTDVPTGTRVKADPDTARVLPIADKSPTTNHAATLVDLQPDVRYTITVGTARLWLGNVTLTRNSTGAGAASPTPEAPQAKSRKLTTSRPVPELSPPPTRKIWGNMATLQDHFARHGSDFGAKDPDEYARMAWSLLQSAKAGGLPAKVDPEGVLRVFDPRTGSFAAYNRDGTAKTLFKPRSRDYFDRQPGTPVNLKDRN